MGSALPNASRGKWREASGNFGKGGAGRIEAILNRRQRRERSGGINGRASLFGFLWRAIWARRCCKSLRRGELVNGKRASQRWRREAWKRESYSAVLDVSAQLGLLR